ncbi:MAG: CHASE4 domain-containing protein [Alphaproteobacteria bacterium]
MKRDLLYPVLAICGIGWFGLIAMIYLSSVGQNRVALADSERLVHALTTAEAKKLAASAKDYSWWDDAVRNLLIDFDREWAAGNIGWYLTDNAGVTQTVVFAGDDRIIYAQREGEDLVSPTLADVAGEALLPLVRAARAPGHKSIARDDTIEPVPVHGFVRAGEHLWAVGASVITNEGLAESPTLPDDKATLVLARQIDGALLGQLSDSYGLADLRLLGGGDGSGAVVPVIGFNGDVVGRIGWSPDLPGTTLLTRLVPAAGAGALLTLGLLLAFIRRAETVVEQVKQSAEALARKNDLLAQREGELRSLVDSVADGIVTVNDVGVITALNPSAERILGWRSDDAHGKPVLSVLLGLPADEATGNWHARLERMAGETVTGRRHDGSQFLMELSIGADGGGESARTVVALRDVTERTRAQATLNLLATPMMVLGGDLRPVLANASADMLLDGRDGLSLKDGTVDLWQGGEMAQFRRLVDAAMGLAEQRGSDTGIMTVSRPSGRQAYALLVTTMRAGDGDESPLAAVFVRDPEHRWEVPAKVLHELYELTPAESRVAIELVNGSSPKEVARTFNVSVNTVRNQIKQTYRKTGTSRQSQLVALMLTTAALVSDRLDDVA